MRMFGFIVLFAGVAAFFANPIIGLIVSIVGAVPAFSTMGFQYDSEQNQCREYTSYLGLKTGDWTSLNEFPDIAIRYSLQSTSAFSRAMVEMETSRDHFFLVCLLSESHRKKMVVQKIKDRELAEKESKRLAALWDKKFTVFNPKISTRTQMRKRKSRMNQ